MTHSLLAVVIESIAFCIREAAFHIGLPSDLLVLPTRLVRCKIEDLTYHILRLYLEHYLRRLSLSFLLVFEMTLKFDPPLLNSANPWATSKEDLQALYDCPYTGALTTRTSITGGFGHNDWIHQYCFFHDQDHEPEHHSVHGRLPSSAKSISSLNTLGYSPVSTELYVNMISDIILKSNRSTPKPVVFSVTGTPEDIMTHYESIQSLQDKLWREKSTETRLLMEINLSCPNIAGKPPPAYSKDALIMYLLGLSIASTAGSSIKIGIKTPPYTYQTQFDEIIAALLDPVQYAMNEICPISFITATNTLGNCLVLSEATLPPFSPTAIPAIKSSSGTGIGGLAGSALHPLALGNVATLRRMLDAHKELKHIEIIGVGGVSDAAGYTRMRAVGASAVGVGTALGVEGTGVFEKIWNGLEDKN